MIRIAQVFKIDPKSIKEYKKDHDNIWPEMKKLIREAGIENYSIFFKSDGTLFSYYESQVDEETLTKNLEKASRTETYKKWQKAMEKYFIKKDRSKIGPETIGLEEVFHLN